jgi:hypothetical protein
MNIRHRITLRHGLRTRTDQPALQTSELCDPLSWAAAIAVCIAFLLLIAAIQLHEQLTEVSECTTARR